MKKRFSFELKITGILLVILGLVAITGLYAYRQFTDILADIRENIKPDHRLITAEALINSLNDAELSVKSFSLTRDTAYLSQFYEAAQNTDQKLSELRDLGNSSGIMAHDLDTLEYLVNEKIAVLNELLFLQDQYRVQAVLNQVVDKINEEKEALAEEQYEERKHVLAWLFRKNEVPTDSATGDISLSAVEAGIDALKREERKIEAGMKSHELDLFIADRSITQKIEAMLVKLKTAEQYALHKETAQAEIATQRTNNQIAWFCFATGTLLLFMAALIINYVRHNNRYKIALRNSRREAEGVARAKQQFLANMSHEIRTPMNAIAGFTEQIAKGPLTVEQRNQLNMVQKSTEHLLYIINEVLDFSKLTAKKLKLETIAFKPAEVINEVISYMRASSADKQIRIDCDITDEIPNVLLGDPFRLRQILLNLGSNAVKFTEKGFVSLTIAVLKKDEENTTLQFEIRDTGIGMDKKNLNTVFREFEQADASTSRNFGGSGLGLSIVNMLVSLHRGRIGISSRPGAGTTVCVELPYKIGTVTDLEPKGKKPLRQPKKLRPLSVLIVDDEEYNRKLLATILKNHNATYREACNGKEALREISANPFDVILMDARMPDLNGIEATVELRKSKDIRARNTPVIALTAAVTNDDKEIYRRAGMNGFLAKPFKEQELINEIERVMTNEEKKDTMEKEKEKPNSNRKENLLNLSELQGASNGDVDFYIDMLELFTEGTRKGMDEIQQAQALGDWERMANFAHKISSPCRHVGAKQLYSYLKEIEMRGRQMRDLDTVGELVQKAADETHKILAEVDRELEKERKRGQHE
jgi:signal transduction histidine kinase/CheY-like chemotaxis protein/CHASE3 domain sensor protein/HPt (histidine-containing phosphotransfer) domain-containing protein